MPRVYTQKANKDYPDSGILKGQVYHQWSFRYGGTHRALAYPRPSQLTQSKWSEVYAGQEGIEDAEEASAILDALTNAIDSISSVADEYEEADEAMGGHQGQNYERAEHLRDCLCSELETVQSELEDLIYADCDACGGEGHIDCEGCDGEGEISCEGCDGEAVVDCIACDGSALIDNPDYNATDDESEDQIPCEDCDGGKQACEDCDGDPKQTCEDCHGECNSKCEDCAGEGTVTDMEAV